MTEQARELRKQADLGAALVEKRAQLKKLQAEIDELSQAAAAKKPAAQVQLKMQVVQVLREKLAADDVAQEILRQVLKPSTETTAGHGDTRFGLGLQQPRIVERALAKLRESGAIKVLAEPVLLTTSGQAASFFSGAEFPVLVPVGDDDVGVEFKKAGIQIDVLPVLCDGGFVRLEVRPRLSTIEEGGAVTIGGGLTVPRMRTREINTGVELRFGQTLMLSCLAQPPVSSKDKPANEAEEKAEHDLIILITPTLVEPAAAPIVPRGPTAEKPRNAWWDAWSK